MIAHAGDRVRVTGRMPDEPNPIPIGTVGTVTEVLNEGTQFAQMVVDWDNGRGLMLLPSDPFMVLPRRMGDGDAPG